MDFKYFKYRLAVGFYRISIILGVIFAIIGFLPGMMLSQVINFHPIFGGLIGSLTGFLIGAGIVLLIHWIIRGFIGEIED